MIAFNFEEADLQSVLRALGKLAGMNFILAQGVRAQVTMRVEKIPVSEAFSLIEAILDANNLAAVKSGDIYKIVTASAAHQQGARIALGTDLSEAKGYFTQIVPLQYLSVDGLANILHGMIGQGKVTVHRETNTVILSGSAPVIKEIVTTLKALDVQGQQREVHQIYVYYVNNAKASELANTLMTVLGEEKQLKRPVSADRLPSGAGQPQVPIPPRPGVSAMDADVVVDPTSRLAGQQIRTVGDVRIVADDRTNSLIIKAASRDYEFLEKIIGKLDITPKQVVIEALLAEVRLTDSFASSVEQFLRVGNIALQSYFGGPGALKAPGFLTSRGFTLSFVDREKFSIFLNLIAAHTRVNTVATPHILTQNNKQARIQIGQEVPITTGTQSTVTGGDNIFTTTQQKDIGRILSINPHVNEERQVTLDLELEASDREGTNGAGGQSFSKKTVKTSVVVEDGQSLLIGGIISDNRRREVREIPFLGQLPVLGQYFRTTDESVDKTELLILLTPHVIANPEEGRKLTDQFTQRLKWLEQQMQQLSPSGRTSPKTKMTNPED